MATLQKIRDKGKVIIVVLGLALFAFIAEEFVRSLTYTQNRNRQRIGNINGKKVDIQDYSKLVDEYTDVVKFTSGMNALSDDQMSMLRDQVWSSYVNQVLLEDECEKLGLTVTDAELQQIINQGNSPMLAQTPFRNAQGAFDNNALKQFLSQYNEIVTNPQIPAETKEQYIQMYNYWKFIEKSIRQQTLAQKYQVLLTSTLMSNPVDAKQNFEQRTNESDLLMAMLPYNSIKDSDVTVEDSELKAKYEEMKEIFRNPQENRDIKYIDVTVTASDADRDALMKEMEGYASELENGGNPAKIVREAGSTIAYSTLPISVKTLPRDIEQMLDTLAVGTQKGPFRNAADNTLNIVRLINKTTQPDSIEIRQIGVPGSDMAEIEKRADSIMTVLNAGEPFDTIAKKMDQTATKTWFTSEQYEGMTMDENNRKYVETVTTAPTNSYNKIVLDGQGVLILQVTDRKNFIDKYNVAVIKRVIDFSKDTYGKAYQDISSFLAANPTAEEIEQNAAKAGYTVQSRANVSPAEHTVANVSGTREAMRWIFNKSTKLNEVSALYECGENDHLLVVILTGVHKKGYLPWDDAQVKEFLTNEVIKDKKAEMLAKKMENAKSIAEIAAMTDAVSDTIKHVNYASNAYVTKTASSEPALSGSASNAKKGDLKVGIKGNAGVFAYQVLDQTKTNEKFDQKQEENRSLSIVRRILGNYAATLYQKAEITDNRYLFY